MIDSEGNYKFDPSRLKECHEQCQNEAWLMLHEGRDVIVANTFTQRWEYQPYLDMAQFFHVPVQVIEVHGDFQSIHGVPAEKIKQMRDRWEPHMETV